MLIDGVSTCFRLCFHCLLLIDFQGRVNSLYRVRNGEILQIVKGDPQWPQSFYPLSSSVEIQDGDNIIGQCVYDNNDSRVIRVG